MMTRGERITIMEIVRMLMRKAKATIEEAIAMNDYEYTPRIDNATMTIWGG